jgi:hypothetical protein
MFKIIQEALENENKAFKFKGIAMIKDSISGNGRRYGGELVENTVKAIKTILESTGSYPLSVMADHPGMVSNKTLTTVGKITDIYMEGNNAIIEAEIANTSIGKDVQELIRGKFVEGLSIRASKAKMKKVNIDGQIVNDVLEMELMGVDLVTNPGVKGARVLDILESNEHSGVYVSIDEEEIVSEEDKMDYSKITLEELKQQRADLINVLKDEFKPVIESELGVNDLQESVNNLTTEKKDLEESLETIKGEKETLEGELSTAKTSLEEAQNELKNIKEAEEAAQKAAEKAKLDAHIAESISKLKFADSIKEKIKAKVEVLESAEEVDTKIAEEVEFLNMVIKESTGIDLSGKGHTGENNPDKINEDEEFRRMVMES